MYQSMQIQHCAFVCRGSAEWAHSKKKKVYDGYRKALEKILDVIQYQTKKMIPISTFYLSSQNVEEPDNYSYLIDEISNFLNDLAENPFIHENKIKISVLGKWYSAPSRLIESIKNILDQTKEYDNYFVNFCINYDGQEEIIDACKMVARRVKLGKIDVDAVTKETIKEDLYSSYFLPPDVIVVTGKKKSFSGFLLWDAANAEIMFLDKNFPEINSKDLDKVFKIKK